MSQLHEQPDVVLICANKASCGNKDPVALEQGVRALLEDGSSVVIEQVYTCMSKCHEGEGCTVRVNGEEYDSLQPQEIVDKVSAVKAK